MLWTNGSNSESAAEKINGSVWVRVMSVVWWAGADALKLCLLS